MKAALFKLIAIALLFSFVIIGCETIATPQATESTAVATPSAAPTSGTQSAITFDFDGPLQKDGLPAPWKSRVIKGNLGVSFVTVPELQNHHALQITCQQSHFIVYDESKPFDPKQFPVLSWSWKATVLPTNGDVRTHDAFYYSSGNRNDKVLQVLVAFEGDKVINYSWDTTAPVGTCVDEWSPAAKIKTYIIESGTKNLGVWHEMKVNILSDYQKLYGSSPGKVMGVSVQTSAYHTSSNCAGSVGLIEATRLQP